MLDSETSPRCHKRTSRPTVPLGPIFSSFDLSMGYVPGTQPTPTIPKSHKSPETKIGDCKPPSPRPARSLMTSIPWEAQKFCPGLRAGYPYNGKTSRPELERSIMRNSSGGGITYGILLQNMHRRGRLGGGVDGNQMAAGKWEWEWEVHGSQVTFKNVSQGKDTGRYTVTHRAVCERGEGPRGGGLDPLDPRGG